MVDVLNCTRWKRFIKATAAVGISKIKYESDPSLTLYNYSYAETLKKKKNIAFFNYKKKKKRAPYGFAEKLGFYLFNYLFLFFITRRYRRVSLRVYLLLLLPLHLGFGDFSDRPDHECNGSAVEPSGHLRYRQWWLVRPLDPHGFGVYDDAITDRY